MKLLITTIDEAASDIHQTHIRVRPPKKIPTPYGGRLIWTLPGKTKMIAHLKDKMKIRHRKRWSQVMYMYYLLGHRLMELPISVDRKATIAENTYLLTLDGDIDFQPPAVHLLVDLMKKNKNLGRKLSTIKIIKFQQVIFTVQELLVVASIRLVRDPWSGIKNLSMLLVIGFRKLLNI